MIKFEFNIFYHRIIKCYLANKSCPHPSDENMKIDEEKSETPVKSNWNVLFEYTANDDESAQSCLTKQDQAGAVDEEARESSGMDLSASSAVKAGMFMYATTTLTANNELLSFSSCSSCDSFETTGTDLNNTPPPPPSLMSSDAVETVQVRILIFVY